MKSPTFYYLKNNLFRLRIFIPALTAVFLIIVLFIVFFNPGFLESWYTPIIDPLVAIATTVIALIIGLNQSIRNWEENLPKRLTVHFIYEGRVVLSCYESFLSGASDVRAWSQQIGGQMAGVPFISFFPYIKAEKPIITSSAFEKEKNKPVDIMLYESVFFLKSDEFRDNKGVVTRPEIAGKYLMWLDNNPEKPGNIEVFVNNRPSIPFTITEALEEYTKQNEEKNH